VNRIVWAARLFAVVLLLLFFILMTNLHSKLRRMEAEKQHNAPATQPSTDTKPQ
jgi:hypothetical protein